MSIKTLLTIEQPEISRLIRELRLLTGLTQEQFAAALEITFPTVNRWENGRNKPSPIAIKQIQKMLVEIGDSRKTLLAKYLD